MKSLAAFLALVTLTFATVKLHADPVTATLTVGPTSTAVVLIETPIPGGETFAYTDAQTDISLFPPSVQVADQTFEATYTDIAGVSLLNVTDICVEANVLAPATPCSALAFSFTNLGLGDAFDIAALGAVGLDLTGDVANINFGASIGGGSAEIGFGGGGDGNGGGSTDPSPVPEPGTLSLLATGLFGAASVVRRRFAA
jgi:hypothetical protein